MMARLSRIVVPDIPHHVTSARQSATGAVYAPGRYALYRDLLAERCRSNGVAGLSLLPDANPIHLILTLATADKLSRVVAEAHRRPAT